MLCLIKHVSIVLLSFGEFLAHDRTKCMFSNDEPCMFGHILIDFISC